MQHFTDMVFESVNYMREKIKKQPMLFLYMKAIQIFLESLSINILLTEEMNLTLHNLQGKKTKTKPKFHV